MNQQEVIEYLTKFFHEINVSSLWVMATHGPCKLTVPFINGINGNIKVRENYHGLVGPKSRVLTFAKLEPAVHYIVEFDKYAKKGDLTAKTYMEVLEHKHCLKAETIEMNGN